ncbi:MAG: hypothetical protein SNJ62_10310, partial [Chloracidobacterium sp.]
MRNFLTDTADWTQGDHVHFLAAAFGKLLRKANPGTVVYVRDAAPDIIHRLPQDTYFTDTLRAKGWQVYRVAARADEALNTITSDQAVAQREAKGTATLLLVERNEAGPFDAADDRI